MRALTFGTYDMSVHPRLAVLCEGLRSRGVDVVECNAPLGIDTAARVALLRRPWRLPTLVARLIKSWVTLAWRSRNLPRADFVIVGYLGHLDVFLARLRFPSTPVVLDHLVSAADTALDRGERGRAKLRLLAALDSAALRAADVVIVDTDEHRQCVPERLRARCVVVAVGASQAWFDVKRSQGAADESSGTAPLPALRVIFFGLYTPLQGTWVIGEALADLVNEPIDVTMVGQGQDYDRTRSAAQDSKRVTWVNWVRPAALPSLVAAHDVCLGIFGTRPKALRVVPNKVYQGAAAGCAIVTSDTRPQRRALGCAAAFVPPGDPAALARLLRRCAADRAEVSRLQREASIHARRFFRGDELVKPLLKCLRIGAGAQ